jgi:hypothetical protein
MMRFTPMINEAGNGALLAMATAMLVFLMLYISRSWNDRPLYQDFASFHRSYENRAALGMSTFFFGFCLKEGSEWWFLHLKAHGHTPDYPLIIWAFIIGTLTSLWGMTCLLAALSRYDWGANRWILIGAAALIFGVTFAIL